MKVSIIQAVDYANFSYNHAMSLCDHGIDATAYVYSRHKFGYIKQATVVNESQMKQVIKDSDIVIVGHSDSKMYQLVKNGEAKRLFVWHTGTRYRLRSESHNESWNPIVEKCIIALGEFATMGAKDWTYLTTCLDVNQFHCDYTNKEVLTFGHYPSDPVVKGTASINEVMKELKLLFPEDYRYICDTKILSHTESLYRMKNCDVYIEMLAPTNHGKPYGSFGTTALEAAALGKVVITNNLYPEVVDSEGLNIANDAHILHGFVKAFIQNKGFITALKQDARKWVEENHSLQASGNKLISILGL